MTNQEQDRQRYIDAGLGMLYDHSAAMWRNSDNLSNCQFNALLAETTWLMNELYKREALLL